MKKEYVLLTGYAGFLGSRLLKDLLEKGYKVIGIDNLSEGSDIRNYQEFIGQFECIIADIADPALKQLLDNYIIDYVISCGAASHVDRSWDQANKFIRSNIEGPVNLAKIFLKRNIKKFVHVSTDEVFSGAPQPFTEKSTILPENIYSSTKASADFLLLNYYQGFNFPVVITHGGNTYGQNQYHEKIIPLSIKRILNKEKIPLFRTPARRMWLNVECHSSAIIKAMEKGKIGERYCLAPESINELYTEDLVRMIVKIMGKKFDEVVEYVSDRITYDLRYWMLNDKAKKDLNWHPKKNINEELEKLIEWYIKYRF